MRLVTAVVMLLGATAICSAAESQPDAIAVKSSERSGSSAPQLSDAALQAAVMRELKHDPLVAVERLEVEAADGIVTLRGSQPILIAKDRAIHAAETVRGVREVIDRIMLLPRREVDGARLESDITYALLTDPATEHAQIVVAASDWGEVTLSGAVDSGAERHLAEQTVKSIAGVRSVSNELQVEHGPRSDHEIVEDVRRVLQWDAYVDSGAIDVTARDGVVALTGTVSSAAEKRRAINQSAVAGVKHVDASALNVHPVPERRDHRGASPEPGSDEAMAAAVRRALDADPRLSGAKIAIDVEGAVVTLKGTVSSLKAKRIASSVPYSVLGVRSVLDRLRVGGVWSYGDNEIRRRVERALALNSVTNGDRIRVQVQDSAVTLAGEVDDWFSHRTAEELASAVRGVRAVNNEIEVDADENAFQGGAVSVKSTLTVRN